MAQIKKTFSISAKPKLTDNEGEQTLGIELSYCDSLREFLRDNVIIGSLDPVIEKVDGFTFTRYKVKSGILSRVENARGKLLFSKDLIDNGEVTINMNDHIYDLSAELKVALDQVMNAVCEVVTELTVNFEK